MELYLVAGVVLFIVIFYSWYASIITKRNQVLEALSGIDVQLKKRHSLIPNILTIAKKFMEHEKSLLSEITELRTRALEYANVKDSSLTEKKFDVESKLQSCLGQLFVSLENYPQLKSDQTMLQAMQTYNEIEEHIAAARRFYNSAVSALLNSIQIFPGNIIANVAGIDEMPYFQTEESSRADINATDYL